MMDPTAPWYITADRRYVKLGSTVWITDEFGEAEPATIMSVGPPARIGEIPEAVAVLEKRQNWADIEDCYSSKEAALEALRKDAT